MTYKFDKGERWVKSALLGEGFMEHYDISRRTPTSSGPVIAQVLLSHITEEARRTASERADLICSIPELINRAAQAEQERDTLERRVEQMQSVIDALNADNDALEEQLKQAHGRITALESERVTMLVNSIRGQS